MTHFGLLCPAAPGHLHPMTTLGHELNRRGHRVTLVGIADARPKVEAAGLEFRPIGAVACPQGFSRDGLARIGAQGGLEAVRTTLALLQQTTAVVLREAPAACRELGVEALLIDQTSFGGPSVAEALDLPFVSVSSALLLNQEAGVPPIHTGWRYHPGRWARLRNRVGHRLWNRLTQPIQDLVDDHRRQAGLPPRAKDEPPAQLRAQICQQPAEFEFPRQRLPANLHFTGPLIDPGSRGPVAFPWEEITGQPLIYASLGTIQNRQLPLYAAIAAACRDLDAQLVIALGGGVPPEALPPLPGSPLVTGYAPQLELLERAALTITHAGLNTVLESLSHGVPMVAIPITNDQPGVAARVAWSGTGAVVAAGRLTVPRLRCAVTQVWHDASCRRNARRLQQAIARAGGVRRAADLVEQAIAPAAHP